jgi:ABC-type transport system substrate-binding protein
LDPNLDLQPDLANSWQASKNGLEWRFELKTGQVDHEQESITADRLLECFENYRVGKPPSTVAAAFTNWTATRIQGRSVVFELKRPDPYFPRNVSLLRYFREEGRGACEEPTGRKPLIGSGPFRMATWDPSPKTEFTLEPVGSSEAPRFQFKIIRDENSMVLRLLRGELDAVQNVLSATKARWLLQTHGDQFRMLTRDGVNVSYLAFNHGDPLLSRLEVRKAISMSIDREKITRYKFPDFTTPAGSFLSPLLPESYPARFSFDLKEAERILDQAGLPRKSNGWRFNLRYKTTPVREGYELALMIQEMLSKIGIKIELEVIEPAVLLASVRKRAYQIHSSRWIGVADGSILYRTLRSDQPNNRAGYKNEVMDQLLEQANQERDLEPRKKVLKAVQEKMAADFAYFPLWFWNNALILRNDVSGISPSEISLSGAYLPLMKLRRSPR